MTKKKEEQASGKWRGFTFYCANGRIRLVSTEILNFRLSTSNHGTSSMGSKIPNEPQITVPRTECTVVMGKNESMPRKLVPNLFVEQKSPKQRFTRSEEKPKKRARLKHTTTVLPAKRENNNHSLSKEGKGTRLSLIWRQFRMLCQVRRQTRHDSTCRRNRPTSQITQRLRSSTNKWKTVKKRKEKSTLRKKIKKRLQTLPFAKPQIR